MQNFNRACSNRLIVKTRSIQAAHTTIPNLSKVGSLKSKSQHFAVWIPFQHLLGILETNPMWSRTRGCIAHSWRLCVSFRFYTRDKTAPISNSGAECLLTETGTLFSIRPTESWREASAAPYWLTELSDDSVGCSMFCGISKVFSQDCWPVVNRPTSSFRLSSPKLT